MGNDIGHTVVGECDRMNCQPDRPGPNWFLCAFFTFFALISAQTSVASITLPQANGEPLTLAAPAKRIITLAPNLAELVFAAGAGEHLKGVVEYSHFPAGETDHPHRRCIPNRP